MMIHYSDCAARAAPCSCGLEDRFKTMITLLSIVCFLLLTLAANLSLIARMVVFS